MSTLSLDERADLARARWWSLLIGAAAFAICGIGAPFSPAQFFRSYLASYLFYQGIGLGCLAILMIYYLTGGTGGS